MSTALEELAHLRASHETAGRRLFSICSGDIFPAHALYLAVLNRSLELFDGFTLLMQQGHYGCCAGLLRMQLDNVLRFYGVMLTNDPHDTANKVFSGTHLRKLKDRAGVKMTDAYLVTNLSKRNPWVHHVYEFSSGFIHLSDQHIHHLLTRSVPAADGERKFSIGSNDDGLGEKRKAELVNAFLEITNGVFLLLDEWEKLCQKDNPQELKKKYKQYAITSRSS